MKRVFNIIFPLLLGLVIAAAFFWHRWYHGVVVAEARFRGKAPFHDLETVCLVRQYPKSVIPFASDGYFYGCEVHWRQLLMSASAYSWDSYTADRFQIDMASANEAVFTIGSYRFRWRGGGWQGSTLEEIP